MWDKVPWPGMETGPPALGVQNLSCWTTREVPKIFSFCLSRFELSFCHLHWLKCNMYDFVWWYIYTLQCYVFECIFVYIHICADTYEMCVPIYLHVPLCVLVILCSYQFSSVQLLSHVWLCNPMDCSTPDFPVHYQLPELAQTHVHWVHWIS